MKTNSPRVVATVVACLTLFIFWYGGLDLGQRGYAQAAALVTAIGSYMHVEINEEGEITLEQVKRMYESTNK
jgi:hypothetical protein